MDKVKEIDIHGLTVAEAGYELERFLEYLPDDTREVVVVHGYRQGKSLLRMVRNDFKHKKIKRKIISMNPGITIFLLQ